MMERGAWRLLARCGPICQQRVDEEFGSDAWTSLRDCDVALRASRGNFWIFPRLSGHRQQVQTEARPKRAAPTWSATTLSGHKVEIRHRMDLKPLISLCETVDGKRSQICQVIPSHFVDAEVSQKLMIQVASDFVSGVVQMLRSTKMSSS